MTFQQTPQSELAGRPARVRFLAEIPRETFKAIELDLEHLPNWDRYFIMNNPVAWPQGMHEVIDRHLSITV